MKTGFSILIKGVVQGVGFRPFIYKTALELGLSGYVQNTSQGVVIQVDCENSILDKFISIIRTSPPPRSKITELTFTDSELGGFTNFEIRSSGKSGVKTADISPDLAVCDDCLEEMNDSNNRRFRYPFINCTNCGPRYSIIESIPYDRPNTTMKSFEMCTPCRNEYEDPLDRRFHAQPTACPDCGPQVELWDNSGKILSTGDAAISATISKIKDGRIVAFKGLGGFQLIADASNNKAVRELRKRKNREDKPFALMLRDIAAAVGICEISLAEKLLMTSTESPIVILKRKVNAPAEQVCGYVAPMNPYLGVMLPYTPLHHLIMSELPNPIVATSGNLSDESMAYDERDALLRFRGIADCFLVHNRPIQRPVDDSIVRVVDGRMMILRLARGYAPMKVKIPADFHPAAQDDCLAVGAHLKNSVAVKKGDSIILSQHIGDLGSAQTNATFRETINDLKKLYEIEPSGVVCDLHPDYISSQFARESQTIHETQHHTAHIASCIFENNFHGDALGVSWDGTGLGLDGTSWGGEFFTVANGRIEHFAGMRKFPLPGGDKAAREPRRTALGLLHTVYGAELFERKFSFLDAFSQTELDLLKQALAKGVNCPLTSSVGRIFDAVSALLGICYESTFEAKGAMMLEFAADETSAGCYKYILGGSSPIVIDWQPMVKDIMNEIENDVTHAEISAKFHNTLVEIISEIAEVSDNKTVILSGGCFQNSVLLKKAFTILTEKGLTVLINKDIPINDGGIAFGQIASLLMESSSK